ncbi:MAG: M61 family peptidase [Oscillatoriales cyanobacterium]|nr:MAG: M61 family peptidase [Oscillatoriales cyanobacterium]
MLNQSPEQRPTLAYCVAMPQPQTHLFEIELVVQGWQSTVLDLKFPVWTPGSYLVREYERHLQDFVAIDSTNQPLPWRKLAKNHWQIAIGSRDCITIRYRLFANELTVRTNHLDSTHAYFNGAATFLYPQGGLSLPLQITIALPHPDWRVATALPPVTPAQITGFSGVDQAALDGQYLTFQAADFDELVDSPFEIGTHDSYEFEVLGKQHQLVVWGQGNLQTTAAIADMQKMIQTEAELFGGLPYDRYLFILHLTNHGYGGLEHKNSCSLIYSRYGFGQPDKLNQFMQLVAHEFFHLWNVKRIRPKELETFDYEGENYTPSLWFSEGTTSYYDLQIPYRSGIYKRAEFLNQLGKEITRYLNTPGRLVQPLAESSFDAWIKLYRAEAHSANHQISYYIKGEMLSLLLDLKIRAKFNNQRSLDDALQQLWQIFGQPERGFTAQELESTIAQVADEDLSDFFQRYLHTTEELPLQTYLDPFGLQLKPMFDRPDRPVPYGGLRLASEHGREVVKFTEAGSPAYVAGIDPGDEILAIDGLRLGPNQWGDRLADYQAGDHCTLTYFHQDELRTATLLLEPAKPNRYDVVVRKNLTTDQEQLLCGWLPLP